MFSKSSKYALRAVIYLAINASADEKKGVETIAQDLNVPRHFLAKILQHLAKFNLISSIKGPNGGFYLDKSNKHLTLLEVVECMEGTQILQSCALGLSECSHENPCPVHDQMVKHRNELRSILTARSVMQIAKITKAKQLRI